MKKRSKVKIIYNNNYSGSYIYYKNTFIGARSYRGK